MSPRSGPAGTPVTIHLKGVGWTEYDNIYVATYDNAYMGYACGFNSHGDVVINFTATGEPGAHLIDLYPGIYQGPPTEPQQLYRLPQLTYADDHPGNKIPALRFTFDGDAAARTACADRNARLMPLRLQANGVLLNPGVTMGTARCLRASRTSKPSAARCLMWRSRPAGVSRR